MPKQTKTRVLFLVQLPPPLHGASTMNQSVFNAISTDNQFETRLISLSFARDLADLQKVRFGKIVKAFAILFRLIGQLLTFRPHTVYFSMVPLNFVLIRDAIYLLTIKILSPKSKYVLHFHRSGLIEYATKWRLKWFYRLLFRRCDIIHLSESLVKKEIEPLNLKNVKIHAIPNFIDDIEPIPEKTISVGHDNILFLSNLLPHKGYNTLVDAFALLEKEYPNLTLTIAGPAPSQNVFIELKNKITTLGLDKKVLVTGKVDGAEKRKLFANATIFVLPSEREYFPLVVLEAMAYGVAVISSSRDNLECYFQDGKEIMYIDAIKPSSIAKHLKKLIDEPDLRNIIASNASLKSKEIQRESVNRLKELLKAT
ncbi:MAG: glycosyltransferase family 4 protein [Bacteroidales bacterium]|nr:glycosyltransferase family 4 protein [Bacteroidales bacterium]MDD4671385.1 glycosyltransferase family 4 protein [Bacteroidales bacterium]MDY0347700.1 glycosyltransferase family 4 protein [Tenuifilaceae bacterium]